MFAIGGEVSGVHNLMPFLLIGIGVDDMFVIANAILSHGAFVWREVGTDINHEVGLNFLKLKNGPQLFCFKATKNQNPQDTKQLTYIHQGPLVKVWFS